MAVFEALQLIPAAAASPDPYVDGLKAIPFLLLLLGWARFVTWVDKDAPEILLPRVWINVGTLSGGILAVLCFFLIPNFYAATGVTALVLIFVIAGYLGVRIQRAGFDDLKQKIVGAFKRDRSDDDDEEDYSEGVQFAGAKGNMVSRPDDESPDADSHDSAQALLVSPLRKDAERLDLTPAEDGYKLKFLVDGVGYSGGAVDRKKAASIISYLKKVAGLDLEELRKPQTGTLYLLVNGAKRNFQIQTAGSSAGESLKLLSDPKKRHNRLITQLGIPADQLEAIKETILSEKGIILLSAPKGQGLTTLTYALLRAHDAFLNHIQTVEREPDTDIEGVTQHSLPAVPPPGEEAKQIEWATSQQPDILGIPVIEEAKSTQSIIRFTSSEEGKLVYAGLRASGTFDTLTQWCKLVGDPKLAMKNVRYVINSRLVRRLCPTCKVAYKPDPATLRKLNMDPKTVTELFQARTQPLTDPKGNPMRCEICQDLRFKGRLGVYEVLKVDDDIRALMVAGANSNQFRAAFRKQRGKFLQERGIELVETGETSVQEVLRALKSDEAGGGKAGGDGSEPSSPRDPAPDAGASPRRSSTKPPSSKPKPKVKPSVQGS